MKKIVHPIAWVLVLLTIMLTGCAKSDFGVMNNGDSKVEIVAENAAKDSFGSTGVFTVNEGDIVLVEPNLKKGAITIQLIPFEGADDINTDMENFSTQGEPELELDILGTEPVECYPSAGDYMINALVTDKASGSVVLRTEPSGLANTGSDSDGSITVLINTEGMGQIAYAEEGNKPEFNDEIPSQSAQISLTETQTYVLGAKADEGWKFVKWTKDGEDFSEEEQIIVKLDSSAVFVAVFENED